MATVNQIIGEVSEAVGDVELERITKEQVIVLINASARDLITAGIVLPLDDETLTEAGATYEFNVPAGFAYIDEVWEESSTVGQYDRRILRNQWYIRLIATVPTLIFEPDLFTITAGRALKLVGRQRPTDTYVIGTGAIDVGLESFIRTRTVAYSAQHLAGFSIEETKTALEGIATASFGESEGLLATLLTKPHFRPALHSRQVPLR